MKRSTQIGLAAAGVVLVAVAWSRSGDESDETFVYNSLADCRAAGQLTASQCEQRFNEASANHLRDAKKFSSTAACEAEYGTSSCQSSTWNGAQVVIPALAGIMLARSLAQGGGAAAPLLPPTRQACPPGSQAPECREARSSSSSGSGGSGGGGAAAGPAPTRRPRDSRWSHATSRRPASPACRAPARAAASARPRALSAPRPRPEMRRVAVEPRPDWQAQVERLGFAFHTIDGETYWDESAAYAFTLEEIERDIETPTGEIEQLCFSFIERAIDDDAILTRLAIPQPQWALIRDSWRRGDRNLYGRLDLAYDGKGPAKLLEYNADTPTALFESGVVQWDWLEQAMARGALPPGCDQFNSLHERLIAAFAALRDPSPYRLHLTCVRDSAEDKGTVDYLQDCAVQAGLDARFTYIEEIGLLSDGRFCDGANLPIETLFKLYPWEWLFRENYADALATSRCQFVEPPWKALLSNKGLLACLWEMEPGHPNLLPAFFEGDPGCSGLGPRHVRKPLYSREGANIALIERGRVLDSDDGPYGAEGYVLQDAAILPAYDGNYAVLGSWLVASQPCGLCIREDTTPITKNSSRFLPHYIEP